MELTKAWLFVWSLQPSPRLTALYDAAKDMRFVFPRSPYTPIASQGLDRIDTKLNGFWEDKVASVFYHTRRLAELGYAERLYVIEFNDPKLANKNAFGNDYSSKIADLISQLENMDNTAYNLPKGFHCCNSSLLLVEPATRLIPEKGLPPQELQDIALELMRTVGISVESVCQPHLLIDTFLLPGIGIGRMYEELVAVNAGVPFRIEEALVLSLVILHILEYLLNCRKLADANMSLSKHIFARQSIQRYVKHRFEVPSSKRSSKELGDEYEKIFLEDKEAALAVC
jgi:hypothetical protein